jgi:hypothetical protein
VLFHAEFQSFRDATMPRRVGGYLVLLSTRHDAPVRSLVAYLSTTVPRAERTGVYALPATPENPEVELRYRVLVLPEELFSELVTSERPSLAVLAPVLRGGSSFKALRDAVGLLVKNYGEHPVFPRLVTLQYLLVELYSRTKEWRMAMQAHDVEIDQVVDLENDQLVQKFLQMIERHRHEGEREGIEKGREEGRRQILLSIARSRFGASVAESLVSIEDVGALEAQVMELL